MGAPAFARILRLGLVSILALTAAAQAAPHAKPQPRAQAVIVRATIVSGNLQTAHAYVDTGATMYVTEFPAMLVVAVKAEALEGQKRRVRFHCATKGCTLAPAEQPNDGRGIDVVDPATKDADLVDGRATIGIAVEAQRPDATYVITATPLVQKGERAVPASFSLTSR